MLDLEYLHTLLEENRAAFKAQVREFSIGNTRFAFNTRPAVMGVINLSPDSWYRESVCLSADTAIRRAHVLWEQGAEILDIGAESTLAHAARAGVSTQTGRLLPVIKELAGAGMLVSVETYQAEVTKACLGAGAKVLNLTGNAGSGDMFRLAADHDAAVIICYVEGENVREVADFDFSSESVGKMEQYFLRQIALAQSCGLEKIFIDPGLGFYYRNLNDSATRVRHQMQVFLNTFRLRKLGFPICHALPHAFEYFGDEVRSAEPFFAVLAWLGRTDLFRTHEVSKVKAVLDTLRIF